MALEKPIAGRGGLNGEELTQLLLWYTDEKKTQLGLKPVKVAKWTAIVVGNVQPPSYEKWTVEREAGLVKLRKKDITIGDTAFGRHVAGKKRELSASVKHHDRAERAALRAELDGLDAVADATQTGEDGDEAAT